MSCVKSLFPEGLSYSNSKTGDRKDLDQLFENFIQQSVWLLSRGEQCQQRQSTFDWIRKQTLVNGERYITEELKVYEEKILNAEDKLIVIEQRIFNALVHHTTDFIPQIQQNARVLAQLDCLLSFALVAQANRYSKP
jgi:DNA mismatch repair ATPase MutS